MPELHKKYDYSISTIHRNFTRLGLKCHSVKENGRLYHYDYNYFDNIDTEDKAYFLGIMYSDGYITSNAIGITLKSDDIDVLQKFLFYLKSDAKISIYQNNGYDGKYKKTEYCRIIIRNKHLMESAISQGVLPHKSLELKPPKIREDLIRHFIRGFMDGDGSIYGKKNHSVSFTGTYDMLDYIGDFFVSNGVIKRFSIYPEHNSNKTYSLKIGGNIQCKNALDLLYKDANVYMERKHNIYLQIKQ